MFQSTPDLSQVSVAVCWYQCTLRRGERERERERERGAWWEQTV